MNVVKTAKPEGDISEVMNNPVEGPTNLPEPNPRPQKAKALVVLVMFVILAMGGFYLWLRFTRNPILEDEQSETTESAFGGLLDPVNPEVKKVVATKTVPPVAITPQPGTIPAPKIVQTEPAKKLDPEPPEDNEDPEVKLLTAYLSGGFSAGDTVHITARAEDDDDDDGIERVEFYVDGERKVTLYTRDIGGDDLSSSDTSKLDSATSKAMDWLEDKRDDEISGYVFRDRRNWKEFDDDCDIDKGYIIIFSGDKKMYDVRVSDDLEDFELCAEGKTLNVGELYYYVLSDVEKGTREIYAKAFDTWGATEKTEKYEIEVD
ncbi:MAG: Ig-like domain-containing protein [Patescibacteria group bacterium]|jgi:hypothetical protein